MRRLGVPLLLALVSIGLAGCGADVPTEVPPPAIPLTVVMQPLPTVPPPTPLPTEAPPAITPETPTPLPATVPVGAGGWREFTSQAGNFRVLLPGPPKEQIVSATVAGAQITMHTFLLADETVSFIVAYADYPADVVTRLGATALLKSVHDNALRSADTQLLRETQSPWHGYPAIALSAQTDNAVLRVRGYLVANRLYTLSGSTADDAAQGDNVLRFLDSFDLLNPVPTATPTVLGGTPAARPTVTPTLPRARSSATPTRLPRIRP